MRIDVNFVKNLVILNANGEMRSGCHSMDSVKRTTVLKTKILWRNHYGSGLYP
jgi:hypothetical protein